MIKTYTFKSTKPGKKMLIFGAIHGNEVCGPNAIFKFIEKMKALEFKLYAGEITFVPICNPKAYEQGKRMIDENLNRVMKKWENPTTYEQQLANELCPLIEKCDYFVDLHSMTCKGKPFAFSDYPTPKNIEFAKNLGINDIVTGWPELYAENNEQSYTTEYYANEHNKPATLIECGQNGSIEADNNAYRALVSALYCMNILQERRKVKRLATNMIKMTKMIKKEQSGALKREFEHLGEVKKDEIIVTNQDGSTIKAPFNSYVLLPNNNPIYDNIWCYLGVKY